MGRQRGGWAAQECLKPVLNEDNLGSRCELFFDQEEAWRKFMSRASRFLAATRRA